MDSLSGYFTGFLGVLLLTSFVKILTTLNILRYGIGLKGGGFGLVVFGASIALSLLVMTPQIQQAGGVQSLLFEQSAQKIEEHFRPFLEAHTNNDIKVRFTSLALRLGGTDGQKVISPAPAPQSIPMTVLVPAFLFSQLKEAFLVGFIILIPFLVVDLLVVNVLMSLGLNQMSQTLVSLPIKLLLFFAVDGWTLISEKLVSGYL